MLLPFVAMTLIVIFSVQAAEEPVPEVKRGIDTPQAIGAAHTLRQIPEACVRLEGVFTGDAAQPYRMTPARTSPNCQPRARFVDFAQARPSLAAGWKLNDVIRIPNAACPSQMAVLRVWRKPVEVVPELDGQGQSRIYLEEAKKQAQAGQVPGVTTYAAEFNLEGACAGQ